MFGMYARYNREANNKILALLEGLSCEEREKDRGSYYGSLSGLVRHILGGTVFFQGMFKGALGNNAAAQRALEPPGAINIPKDVLTEAQWKLLAEAVQTADEAFVNLTGALSEEDLKAPVKIDWYGGNPPSVPLSFMIHQFITHGIHHRGQISQILDELKIDNDYSGIDVQFLP
jgi:uncharacterized damage-inducible protein DinB